jgi:hypothetical protein
MKSKLDFLLAIQADRINDAHLTHSQRIQISMTVNKLLSFYKIPHTSLEINKLQREQIVKIRKLQTVRQAIEYFMDLQALLEKIAEKKVDYTKTKNLLSTTPLRSTITQNHVVQSSSTSSTSSISEVQEAFRQESTSTSTKQSSLLESPQRVLNSQRALKPKDPFDPKAIPTLDLSATPSNKAPRIHNGVPRVKKIDSDIATAHDARELLIKRALKKLKKRDINKPRHKTKKSLLSISTTISTHNKEDESISLSSSSNEGAVLVRKSRFTILSPEELQAIRNPELLSSTSLSSSSTSEPKGVVIAGKLPTLSSPSSDKKGRDR